jgi:hypothetical protein
VATASPTASGQQKCDGDGGHHDTDTTTSAAVASTLIAFVPLTTAGRDRCSNVHPQRLAAPIAWGQETPINPINIGCAALHPEPNDQEGGSIGGTEAALITDYVPAVRQGRRIVHGSRCRRTSLSGAEQRCL